MKLLEMPENRTSFLSEYNSNIKSMCLYLRAGYKHINLDRSFAV